MDPLIAYLGEWLKEGDSAGTLSISVWQHMGMPEDLRTPFGQHDGYTVDWCSSLDKGSQRLIVLTGQGSHVFEPLIPDQPEDIEKHGNSAVAIGREGSAGVALISRPGCNVTGRAVRSRERISERGERGALARVEEPGPPADKGLLQRLP